MPLIDSLFGSEINFFLTVLQSLGGRVETKVPRNGYILVENGTSEEVRLRVCWSNADRPERYFVPYTYVEACKIAGMLLKQIFVENGSPIPMHIHHSIANVNARSALSQRIMVLCIFYIFPGALMMISFFASTLAATQVPRQRPRASYWQTPTPTFSNI
jgi:hypothetical protein